MWRSLIRPRRLVLLAITLLVSVTSIRLGVWQWHRLQERRAHHEAGGWGGGHARARHPPYPTLPILVGLQSRSRGQPAGTPTPAPPPPLSEGPHEGYMLQWFAFAAVFLGGFVVLVSRDGRALPRAEAGRDWRAHAAGRAGRPRGRGPGAAPSEREF